MKTVVSENPYKPENEPFYPYIGKSRDTGNVVLFSGPHEGTFLAKGAGIISSLKVGDHSSDWAEEAFCRLDGYITLSND